MGARIVAVIPEPNNRPCQGDGNEQKEGGAPGEDCNQAGDNQRGGRTAHTQKGRVNPWGKPPLAFGPQGGNRASRGGKPCPFPDAEKDAGEKKQTHAPRGP